MEFIIEPAEGRTRLLNPGYTLQQHTRQPDSTMNEASGARAETGATNSPAASLRLPSDLQSIFEQSYPRFSDAEYARRHAGIARAMAAAGADHVLVVTVQNVGNATRWMTGWPGTAEALLLFRPPERMVMFVEYYNHLP